MSTDGVEKSLVPLRIDFIDTHSRSMTRQVTAPAAMTLAVLMSSLEKMNTQHNQAQLQN